jgi:outer membrane protein TolC
LFDFDTRDVLVQALQFRPEIDEAMQQVSMASVRREISRNELLPVLNLVIEAYVSGLEGNSGVGRAWVDQFSVGEPSYAAGLLFEVPIHNRGAKARFTRRTLELRQLVNQLKSTVEFLMAEVEIAVRDVGTSRVEVSGKFRSMKAEQAEVDYLTQRWELLPGDDRSASFLLEDLLDAQDRLEIAENEFVRAQVDYTFSLTELKRVMGTLLRTEPVVPVRSIDENCLPSMTFGTGPTPDGIIESSTWRDGKAPLELIEPPSSSR